MHLDNGLAALCMGGGAWVGARCWLGGMGRGLFPWTCDVINGGLLHEKIWILYLGHAPSHPTSTVVLASPEINFAI